MTTEKNQLKWEAVKLGHSSPSQQLISLVDNIFILAVFELIIQKYWDRSRNKKGKNKDASLRHTILIFLT